jgi:hypothetical protein
MRVKTPPFLLPYSFLHFAIILGAREMAEPVSLQTLLTYLTLISVPVGVVYHILTLRNTKRNQGLTLETRQAQLFMQVANQSISDPEFMMAWNRIREASWGSLEEWLEWQEDPQNMEDSLRVGGVLESLAVLVKEELVSIRLVALLMTNVVNDYWEKYGPFLKHMTESGEMEGEYEIEYLYDTLVEYRENRSPR